MEVGNGPPLNLNSTWTYKQRHHFLYLDRVNTQMSNVSIAVLGFVSSLPVDSLWAWHHGLLPKNNHKNNPSISTETNVFSTVLVLQSILTGTRDLGLCPVSYLALRSPFSWLISECQQSLWLSLSSLSPPYPRAIVGISTAISAVESENILVLASLFCNLYARTFILARWLIVGSWSIVSILWWPLPRTS